MKEVMQTKARKAWGDAIPAEVETLARLADRITQRKAAERIGYSNAVVSYVLGNKYTGDIDRVKAKIRGALMNETVMCPILGEIGTDRCLNEQKMDNTGASSIRARLYRACRSGCPHSRIKEDGDA
ncbi:transcriptional regulator [Bradyrhizobium sp. 31Argb]|uniref:transcriptional regulator n=1 Tax=Bradyrhizobium sp. 31Argb TaxID=3141247 RepID=UPI003747F22B